MTKPDDIPLLSIGLPVRTGLKARRLGLSRDGTGGFGQVLGLRTGWSTPRRDQEPAPCMGWHGRQGALGHHGLSPFFELGAPGGVTAPPPGVPHHSPQLTRDASRPVVFGYVRAPLMAPGARSPSASLWRTAIARFAIRERLTLAQVFVETRTQQPWTALNSLLEAARFTPIHAVVIPDRTHLGYLPAEQQACRQAIQHETGCRVIAIHPARHG